MKQCYSVTILHLFTAWDVYACLRVRTCVLA